MSILNIAETIKNLPYEIKNHFKVNMLMACINLVSCLALFAAGIFPANLLIFFLLPAGWLVLNGVSDLYSILSGNIRMYEGICSDIQEEKLSFGINPTQKSKVMVDYDGLSIQFYAPQNKFKKGNLIRMYVNTNNIIQDNEIVSFNPVFMAVKVAEH